MWGGRGSGSRGATPVHLKRSVTSDLMACPRAQASHFRLGWLHGVVFLVPSPPQAPPPQWPPRCSLSLGWPQGPAPAPPLWSLGTASGGFLGGALWGSVHTAPLQDSGASPQLLGASSCLCGRLAGPLPWERPGAGVTKGCRCLNPACL